MQTNFDRQYVITCQLGSLSLAGQLEIHLNHVCMRTMPELGTFMVGLVFTITGRFTPRSFHTQF